MLHPDIERVALLGWHIYPCSPRSKRGLYKGAHLDSTDDLNQLARWAHDHPHANWRVVFGPSRIWGIDLDVPPGHAEDGIANFHTWIGDRTLPPRPMARSGGGGLALYFRHDGENIVGRTGFPAPGIDPRRGRQSQTIPPSVHIASRKPYRWIVPPWELTPPLAPRWLTEALAPPPEPVYAHEFQPSSGLARRKLDRAYMAVIEAKEGTRNDVLNKRAYGIACFVAQGLLAESEALSVLTEAGLRSGLPHPEVRDTLLSAFRSSRRR